MFDEWQLNFIQQYFIDSCKRKFKISKYIIVIGKKIELFIRENDEINFFGTLKDNRWQMMRTIGILFTEFSLFNLCNNFSHFLTTASNISIHMVGAFISDYVSPMGRMEIRWPLWSNNKKILWIIIFNEIWFVFILRLTLKIKLSFHLHLCVTNQVLYPNNCDERSVRLLGRA